MFGCCTHIRMGKFHEMEWKLTMIQILELAGKPIGEKYM